MYVYIERGLFNIHISNTIHWYIFTCDIRLCILSVWHRNPTFLFQCHSQSQHPYFKIQYSTSLIQHCVLTIQQIYFYYYSHATFVCVLYLNFCSIECLVCVVVQSAICLQRNATFLFGHWIFPFRSRPFSLACLAQFTAYIWCTITWMTCTTTWLTSWHCINQPWANFARRTKKTGRMLVV